LLKSVESTLPKFARIFSDCPNLSQIKTLGVNFHHLTPGSYTTETNNSQVYWSCLTVNNKTVQWFFWRKLHNDTLLLMLQGRGLQTFLPVSHISFHATGRQPDIPSNVIVLGYVTFYQINKCFPQILFIHFWQNDFTRRIWPAGRSLGAPAARGCCTIKNTSYNCNH